MAKKQEIKKTEPKSSKIFKKFSVKKLEKLRSGLDEIMLIYETEIAANDLVKDVGISKNHKKFTESINHHRAVLKVLIAREAALKNNTGEYVELPEPVLD